MFKQITQVLDLKEPVRVPGVSRGGRNKEKQASMKHSTALYPDLLHGSLQSLEEQSGDDDKGPQEQSAKNDEQDEVAKGIRGIDTEADLQVIEKRETTEEMIPGADSYSALTCHETMYYIDSRLLGQESRGSLYNERPQEFKNIPELQGSLCERHFSDIDCNVLDQNVKNGYCEEAKEGSLERCTGRKDSVGARRLVEAFFKERLGYPDHQINMFMMLWMHFLEEEN